MQSGETNLSQYPGSLVLGENAGISVSGPLLHLPLPDYRRQPKVNLVAPFWLPRFSLHCSARGPLRRVATTVGELDIG